MEGVAGIMDNASEKRKQIFSRHFHLGCVLWITVAETETERFGLKSVAAIPSLLLLNACLQTLSLSGRFGGGSGLFAKSM
jgi:hypothetical protein